MSVAESIVQYGFSISLIVNAALLVLSKILNFCYSALQKRITMISFQGRHFPKDLILMAVRWKLAYPLSYRNI
jgi:hypothetical protein